MDWCESNNLLTISPCGAECPSVCNQETGSSWAIEETENARTLGTRMHAYASNFLMISPSVIPAEIFRLGCHLNKEIVRGRSNLKPPPDTFLWNHSGVHPTNARQLLVKRQKTELKHFWFVSSQGSDSRWLEVTWRPSPVDAELWDFFSNLEMQKPVTERKMLETRNDKSKTFKDDS